MMDAASFTQGLTLSLIGMGITFAALGVLILVIVVLKWLFPVKAPARSGEAGSDERERVVALAAAWHYLRAEENSSPALGNLLAGPRGAWWYADKVDED